MGHMVVKLIAVDQREVGYDKEWVRHVLLLALIEIGTHSQGFSLVSVFQEEHSQHSSTIVKS